MIKPGDIVQITDESHHWYPALLVVTEDKGWGVLAYTVMVDNTQNPNGQAFIRLKNEAFERVGRAVIVSKEEEEDDGL